MQTDHVPALGGLTFFLFFIFFIFFMFIYFFERERQSVSGGGAERERLDTEPEVGSRLQAVSTEPAAGLKLTDCEILT